MLFSAFYLKMPPAFLLWDTHHARHDIILQIFVRGIYMKKILFLGDSITDSHRLFINPPLGCGYVSVVSEKLNRLGYDVNISNLGTDGFTLSRILEKYETQYLPLQADLTVLLIGINDIGLMMNTNRTPAQQTFMMESFFTNYEALLHAFASTDTQPILMEPFVFPNPLEYKSWIPYVKQMSHGISLLSERFEIPYIRLHDSLNQEGFAYGMDYITSDGIHLTRQGHEILSEKLLHTLENYV